MGHMAFQEFVEEVQVLRRDLVDRIKSLIHEGNVPRIIVRDEHGNTFIEIPVAEAAAGAVLVLVLAAVGAISALVSKFTVVVVLLCELLLNAIVACGTNSSLTSFLFQERSERSHSGVELHSLTSTPLIRGVSLHFTSSPRLQSLS